MIIRTTAALSAISASLVALPALAQDTPEMSYETAPYAEARQVPAEEYERVIMRSEAVVQPLPGQANSDTGRANPEFAEEYEVVTTDRRAEPMRHAAQHVPLYVPMHHPHAPQIAYPYPAQAAAYPVTPRFDREEWLDECRARQRRGDSKRGILGFLLGAAGGGIAGNRIADGDRLGGTLAGAAIGGIAGTAIDSAISNSSKRRANEDCEAWFDQYYGQYDGREQSSGFYQPQAYVYVYTMQPVLIAVPQKRVVHESVTEDYIDETVIVTETTYVPAKRVEPDKRLKMTPTKRIKSSK